MAISIKTTAQVRMFLIVQFLSHNIAFDNHFDNIICVTYGIYDKQICHLGLGHLGKGFF